MPYLQEVFREFWRDTFSPHFDSKCPVKLKLLQAESAGALKSLLFRSGNAVTSDASRCCLFILDIMVPQEDGRGEEQEINALILDGRPLPDWLDLYFPAIPKLCLTRLGAEAVALPPGWKDLEFKDSMENLDRLKMTFRRLFRKWWDSPFWHELKKYASVDAAESWHTPGHNAGNAFLRSAFQGDVYQAFSMMSFATDLSVSVDKLGDLSEPLHESPLNQARARTAEVFGAHESFYVTNGTSTSNKAMLMTLLRPGEVVVLDRNCHKSVHQAVALSGAIPFYLTPRLNRRFSIWEPIPLADIENSLTAACGLKNCRPRLLILTTCTYEGFLYPIVKIARLCEELGVLFYADEAWCPYIAFHPYYVSGEGMEAFRFDAMHGGAHFTSQSTHKALAAFSQASMIHVSANFARLLESNGNRKWNWLRERFGHAGRGSYDRFRHELVEILRYWHSTSPHYPMLATLDRATVQMRLEGMARLEELLHLVQDLVSNVNDRCFSQGKRAILDMEDILGPHSASTLRADGYIKDPTKIILGFGSEKNCSLFKKELEGAPIQWEKSTDRSIEFLATLGTFRTHFEALKKLLFRHLDIIGVKKSLLRKAPKVTLFDGGSTLGTTPRFAFTGDAELIHLDEAVKEGRVCAQMLVPYPPGIPILLPGMLVTKSAVALVNDTIRRKGAKEVHGLFEHKHAFCLRVLTRVQEQNFKRKHPMEASIIKRVNDARASVERQNVS